MSIRPTEDDGRVAFGVTPWGDYLVEFCDDYDGPVYDAQGREVARLAVMVKTPGDAPSRGLGDTIAKATARLGIKPCGGCKRRQRWLNRIVPYRRGETR